MIVREEGYKVEGDKVVSAPVEGGNQITKTTEITITEIDREDAPEIEPATPGAKSTSPTISKIIKNATPKVTKKRKAADKGTPKEVLKKKQKKVIEQSMREGSADE